MLFVELLLNLAWLLLALPAYWLWRDSRSSHDGHRAASIQILLTLGCMLVILFPVISASDDLQAMRSEMEETPASKRSICQKCGETASAAKWQSQPLAALVSDFSIAPERARNAVPIHLLFTPELHRIELPARAPPHSVIS